MQGLLKKYFIIYRRMQYIERYGRLKQIAFKRKPNFGEKFVVFKKVPLWSMFFTIHCSFLCATIPGHYWRCWPHLRNQNFPSQNHQTLDIVSVECLENKVVNHPVVNVFEVFNTTSNYTSTS